MRTTLTLDDDLVEVLERESKVNHQSFREMVNLAIRRGLIRSAESTSKPTPKVVTRPHSFGTKPALDWNRLNQLSDELETDDFLNKNMHWMK